MERAVASLKWKTTASAACIPRRDSTSPYSMAAIVFPMAPRTVCSLCSGVGGPIILGCSPLLACWLSIHAPSASCGLSLPSDTAHLTLAWLCPPSWDRQARYKLEEVVRWLRQLARYGVPGMRPPRRVWSRPSPSQRSKLSSSSAFAFRSAINVSRRPLYSATASLPIRSTSREVSSTSMPWALRRLLGTPGARHTRFLRWLAIEVREVEVARRLPHRPLAAPVVVGCGRRVQMPCGLPRGGTRKGRRPLPVSRHP